jgi:NTP pyrophosphatase (non-canonical NTP hydrolase)
VAVTGSVQDGRDGRDLGGLQARIRSFADRRDWGPYHTPRNLLLALVGEVGELAELFQWRTDAEAAAVMDDPATAAAVRDELADVTQYLLRLADVLGVDVAAAVEAKLARNEERFPVGGPPGHAPEPAPGPSGDER